MRKITLVLFLTVILSMMPLVAQALIPGEPKASPPSSTVDPTLKIYPNAEPNQRYLVILVNFKDRKITFNNSQDWIELFCKTYGNSIKDYYSEVSEGKVILGACPERYEEYNDGIIEVSIDKDHPGIKSRTNDQINNELNKMVPEIMAQVDQYVDFDKLDDDKNGTLSPKEVIISFVLAGYGAGGGTDDNFPWVPPHCENRSSIFQSMDGKSIDKLCAVFTGEIEKSRTEEDHMATAGVFCHEFGHCFGLSDLYYGVGYESIMGTGGSLNLDGQYQNQCPSHFDAYSKIKLGFIEPKIANKPGIYDVNSIWSETGATVLRINTTNPKECFLIENRELKGFDASLYNYCKYGGIAIWHVNENNSNNDTKDFNKKLVDLEKANTLLAPLAKSVESHNEYLSPYYFYTSDCGYSTLDENIKTGNFISYATTNLMNGDPSGIKIEVLSKSGPNMKVKISTPLVYTDINNQNPKIISFTSTSLNAKGSVNLKAVINENGSLIETLKFCITPISPNASSTYFDAILTNVSPQGYKAYEATVALDYKTDYSAIIETECNNIQKSWSNNRFVISCDPELNNNLALNKPVTVSYEQDNLHAASFAVDGIASYIASSDPNFVIRHADKWCSGQGFGDGSWLTVDLEKVETINRWKVIHEAGSGSGLTHYYTNKFRLQTSFDGENWNDIDVVDNSELKMGVTDRVVAPFRGRYIRLYIDKADNDNCARIAEFQLFNEPLKGIEAHFDSNENDEIGAPIRKLNDPHYLDLFDIYGVVNGDHSDIKDSVKIDGSQYHSYPNSLHLSGSDRSIVYNTIYSDVNIEVTKDTTLSYWLYSANENSRCIGVDLVFTNGEVLSATNAVDQNGNTMHPDFPKGVVNKWTQIRSKIGTWCNGWVIKDILVAYDNKQSLTDEYSGFIDDIVVRNELSSYIGVQADFESDLFVFPEKNKPLGTPHFSDLAILNTHVSNGICQSTNFNQSISGSKSLLVSGNVENAVGFSSRYVYFNLYDNLDLKVNKNTSLSYWLMPKNENGRFVAVDIQFTDGTCLRDYKAVDFNGLSMHANEGKGNVGQWNYITSQIGKWVEGKIIKSIMVAYDQPNVSDTTFMSYIDDIQISNVDAAALTEAKSITGYIKTQNENPTSSDLAEFKVEVIGLGVSTYTDETGYFNLENIAPNEAGYSLEVSKPGILSRTIEGIMVDSSPKILGSTEIPFEITKGDLNSDGAINMADVILIAKVFNSLKGDGIFNKLMDLNNDESINMADVIIIAKSFNQTSK